jgi:tetratricopeptide (TPR) repeat protein
MNDDNLKQAKVFYDEGVMLANAGRHEEAIAAFEQCIRPDPKSAYPWNGKGSALNSLGRHEEALAAFEQCIRLDPKYAYPWNGKGIAFAGNPPLESARGESHEQCFHRAAHLLLGFPSNWSPELASLLLGRFRDDVSLPLLARRLLAAFPFASLTLSYGEFLAHTMRQCEPATKMLAFLESAADLSPVERSLWSGVVCHYYGDDPQARERLEEVDSSDEGNLMGQWYLLESLQAYLEPCEQEKSFALEQAILLLDHSDTDTPVEQAYYAGHIFRLSGDLGRALGCFSHGRSHLPSLYMRWLCLRETKDSAADECLEGILEAEHGLLRRGRCGYLIPQLPPEIDPAQPGWLDDMRFYVHFREVEGAAMEIARLNGLERFPGYRKLFPDTRRRLWGERDVYIDKVKTFRFKAEAERAYSELQRIRTDETAREILGVIRPWLDELGLPESFAADPSGSASAVGEDIARSDLSKREIPHGTIIDYYFIRREIQAEDAIFLHFYHGLKLHHDGADRKGAGKAHRASDYAKALTPLITLVVGTKLGQPELGASLAVALGLVPVITKHCMERSQAALRSKPFPSFVRFKEEFYESEAEIGDRKTLDEGTPKPDVA